MGRLAAIANHVAGIIHKFTQLFGEKLPKNSLDISLES
ncbi:hypothetical protein MGWOODY_Tha332 [hydrothermal vent metagenome]|uniref:Uncharacterized protein n=1 Tax=hydrothermal vent metagenome TaxID=652676 RepID=A0A161KCG1_9ZZZZ